jgi:hypothetical protein
MQPPEQRRLKSPLPLSTKATFVSTDRTADSSEDRSRFQALGPPRDRFVRLVLPRGREGFGMTFQAFKAQFAMARDVVRLKTTQLERNRRSEGDRVGHGIGIAALIPGPQWACAASRSALPLTMDAQHRRSKRPLCVGRPHPRSRCLIRATRAMIELATAWSLAFRPVASDSSKRACTPIGK